LTRLCSVPCGQSRAQHPHRLVRLADAQDRAQRFTDFGFWNPHDRQRNDLCAHLVFLQGANGALALPSPSTEIAAIEANDDLFSFSESWSDYKRRIGFWEFPDGQQYLSDMLQTLVSEWHPHSEQIAS
jgi:hypothetical protein